MKTFGAAARVEKALNIIFVRGHMATTLLLVVWCGTASAFLILERSSKCLHCLGAAREKEYPAAYEVLLDSEDAGAWVEERREYRAIEADPKIPFGLVDVYRRSFTVAPRREDKLRRPSDVRYLHEFDGRYPALEDCDLDNFEDHQKIAIVRELLETVSYLHSRGLPHLGLNSKFVRVCPEKAALKVVAAGAGPRLVATKRPYALPEEFWPFNAPETTGVNAMIIRSNLRALLSMDAWAVGVLVCMIISGSNRSPFEAHSDWTRGIFDDRSAVGIKTKNIFSDFSTFLRNLDRQSNGCLTRHGWLVGIILGLLTLEATDRMTLATALETSSYAAENEPAAAKDVEKKKASSGGELGRYRSEMRAQRTSGEPFRSLEAMVNVIEGGACECVLESRRKKDVVGVSWGSGVPYGEVVGFRNRGDGDRWDIFIPGVPASLESETGLKGVDFNQKLKIEKVLGLVLVKGGNHKIAVQVEGFPPTKNQIFHDVQRFIDAYVDSKPNLSKARVRYLEYGGASQAPPTSSDGGL